MVRPRIHPRLLSVSHLYFDVSIVSPDLSRSHVVEIDAVRQTWVDRERALDRFRTAGMFAVLNAHSASDRLLRGLLPCSFFGEEGANSILGPEVLSPR